MTVTKQQDTPEEFSPQNFNPDCFTSPKEVTPWIEFFNSQPFFSIEGKGFYTQLAAYCVTKRRAMECRLEGNIIDAQSLDARCAYLRNKIASPWNWE